MPKKTVKRDASPQRDYEKENQRVAVLWLEGENAEDDQRFVIPEHALALDDWAVFLYWTTLKNLHTADKTKVPKKLKDAEAMCYSKLVAAFGNETTVPEWHQFRNEADHLGLECPSEHFRISAFY
jgi:hypothetical protein